MIDLFITFDDMDGRLGTYFSACHNSLTDFISENIFHLNVESVPSNICNEIYLDLKLRPKLNNNFIFVAYSHGNALGLTCSNTHYVRTETNTQLFQNCFFYSTACGDGESFAQDLINNGCFCFIGYKASSEVVISLEQVFSNCDNAGLFAFIAKDITARQAFEYMKSYYSQQITFMRKKGELFAAHFLVQSRESLFIAGNENITFSQLSFTQ